jgi:hypothetical protein
MRPELGGEIFFFLCGGFLAPGERAAADWRCDRGGGETEESLELDEDSMELADSSEALSLTRSTAVRRRLSEPPRGAAPL